MANETVIMLAPTRDSVAQAQLLWPATEILSVRDSTLGVELRNGVDFTHEAGMLRVAPSMAQYAFPTADLSVAGQPRWEENHCYHTHQLVVTHLHPSIAINARRRRALERHASAPT